VATRTYRVKEIFGPTIQGEGLHTGMPCLFVRLAGCNAWDGRPETRAASACPYCDTDFRGGEALALAEILSRLNALVGAVPGASQEAKPTASPGLGGSREAALAGGGHPPAPASQEAKPTASEQTSSREAALAGGGHPPAPASQEAKPTASEQTATASEQTGLVLTGGEPLLQADAALLAALGERFAWVDIETNGTRACPPRPGNVFISCSPKALRDEPIVVDPDWWKVLIPDQEAFLPIALAAGKPVFVQPTCPDAGPSGSAYAANVQRCLDLCFAHGCRLSVQVHKYLGVP